MVSSMSTTCSICGKHKGRGFNHKKCSKQLQKLKNGSAENKNPNKRLSKNGNPAGKYFSEHYT